ncbi:hypothetical protein [Amycolatopsis sp. cmx-4-68]|uniref:hypothetical protein n=1 Tax=Amycolatopsis sp. cmx-4-68 TaxID=2790938 RepID=UPI0039799D37
MIFALFTAFLPTSALHDLGEQAGRLHSRILHRRRTAEIDEPAERGRHPHQH